jgi:hypothetical protein
LYYITFLSAGHASVAFTMDVYSHIIGSMQEDAIALLGEVLPEGFSAARRAARENLRSQAPVAQADRAAVS